MEPITRIEVMGKSADEVVEEVVGKLGKSSAGNAGKVFSVMHVCRKHGHCAHMSDVFVRVYWCRRS